MKPFLKTLLVGVLTGGAEAGLTAAKGGKIEYEHLGIMSAVGAFLYILKSPILKEKN